MSFRGYLKTIKEKIGLDAKDFRDKAEEKHYTENGQLKTTVKAGEIVSWLKEYYAMATGILWLFMRY